MKDSSSRKKYIQKSIQVTSTNIEEEKKLITVEQSRPIVNALKKIKELLKYYFNILYLHNSMCINIYYNVYLNKFFL
uniref:Uncharacterized protein n=1 Tax=Heterorhabditis bacteriophora TaxID=37862 RepID=A0A1I7XEU8_HETBA